MEKWWIGITVLVVGVIIVFIVTNKPPDASIPPEVTELNTQTETQTEPMNNNGDQQTKAYDAPPPMQIDETASYSAVLHTDEGDITIQLHADKTPVTVNNFVFLAKDGFYDNTVFHRVIKGFMIQGGDPKGNGTGGPGYQFDDEVFDGEYTRGSVAMANAGPNTNGSQFFIMHEDYALPKNYIIFGQATGGLDVVDKIAEAPVQPGGEGSSPVTPVTVNSVEINEQ